MTKNSKVRIILMAGMAMMAMASCQKDGMVRLSAKLQKYTGNETKVHIDAQNHPIWDVNDQINVNGSTYALADAGSDQVQLDVPHSSTGYYAMYPASCFSAVSGNTATLTIPSVQEYVTAEGNQVVAFPMTAYSANASLSFRNLCSIVKVRVTNDRANEPIMVRSITLEGTAGQKLTGSSTVNITTATASNISNGKNYAYLDCNNASLAVGASKDFYIVTYPFNGAPLKASVTIQKSSNMAMYSYQKTSNGNVAIAKNEMGTIPYAIAGAGTEKLINGYVNGTIVLSKGNLMWNNLRDPKYYMAEHQYDFLGQAWTNNMADHFHWGRTAGQAHNGSAAYTGADFGESLPGNNGFWKTPSKEELTSIMSSYAYARVEGKNGIVVLPDNWQSPVGITLSASTNRSYASHIYTSAQWEVLENAGANFLPAAGYDGASEANMTGRYWTRTTYSGSEAYRMTFSESVAPQFYYSPFVGNPCSVRLIHAL